MTSCSYNPKKENFTLILRAKAWFYIHLVGDFNACMKEFWMSVSCDKQSLKKDTACARTDSFDFHRIAVTSIKISFKRLKPSAMKDGDYYSSKKIILRIIII